MFVTLIAEDAKSKGVPEKEIWEVIMNQLWNRVSVDVFFKCNDNEQPVCTHSSTA